MGQTQTRGQSVSDTVDWVNDDDDEDDDYKIDTSLTLLKFNKVPSTFMNGSRHTIN